MEIITRTFEKLLTSKTVDEVERILDDLKVDMKYRMDDKVYPRLKFKITKQEIEELKEKGIITADNLLADLSDADPLTKLLYSVSWKNGDLKKVKHIIEGIVSGQQDEKENGLVFYQFGKYLTKKPGEPIIDQHVLRAFGVYKANGDKEKLDRLKRLSLITKKEKELIDQYKLWLRTDLRKELRDNDNYSYHVDKVLFAVGKSIKEKS
jgi:signal recognition particle subunit SEC65